MRFAFVEDQLTEAQTGLKGLCPGCSQSVIAKCGKQRINHWAHSSAAVCDDWWEKETEWHRSWKNKFPLEWQESFIRDEISGEKHIADIRTNYDFVIEFQHSHIDPIEVQTREKFYKNMVWVVDGTRLKRDYPRFQKAKKDFRVVKERIFEVQFPEKCLPTSWLKCSVPVIFDFKGNESIDEGTDIHNYLYCLFPIRIRHTARIAEINRSAFVKSIIHDNWLLSIKRYMNILSQPEEERQIQTEKGQIPRENMLMFKFLISKQNREQKRL